MPENLTTTQRNTGIVALNIVSTLSQIGQFGLGTTLIPIALEAKHASPSFIGSTSAAFWLGMLAGLLVAGKLTRNLGYRNTVILGLLLSALSFVLMPLTDWHWWMMPASTIGFGMGLRWIANETWLYRLAPNHARGRVVGIHETLIGIASFTGPMIIVALGVTKPDVFWVSAAIILMAIPALFMATTLPATDNNSAQSSKNLLFWLGFGGLIAGLGGWVEGSLLALLPVYNGDIGLKPSDTAWLFTIFGVGAFVCQFPVGWLSDHKGVLFTTKLCAALGLIAVTCALALGTSLLALASAMFILGGATAGLLTLGMIWATLQGTGAEITNRVRQVSITYTLLSAAGPFVSGFVLSHSSSQSLFWQQLLVLMVLAAVVLKTQHTPSP